MYPKEIEQYFEANKQGWNKRTAVHKDSEFYDLASFRNGQSTLNKLELDSLGDVNGKSLLHLQCHFGLDTLSWARAGASVTGVDFSEDAIKLAKELATEIQLPAEFICCNIYDLPAHLDKKFDIVFTSYGVIGWLPDLDKWASIISSFLKPGGTFFMAEFHPVVWMLDEELKHIVYPYHNAQLIVEEHTGTYTDPDAPIHYTEYSWNHSLGEVVNALINHGLQVQSLGEYPYSYYNCFKHLKRGDDGLWRLRGEELIPMMYSIKATRH